MGPSLKRTGGSLTAVLAVVAGLLVWPLSGSAPAADPCTPPVANKVVCENSKPGSPKSEWEIAGSGDPTIEGFTTDMSVNVGGTVRFKIDTPARGYTIDIYRMGWYGGDGARKIASVNPSAPLPQNQPPCLSDADTLLTDCGNWGVSASWAVPTSAVSGVYLAHLVRNDTGGDNHIVFIVRDDASNSDIAFQTADTTWQAYNSWGGASLYPGPNGQATKVSYNRPFNTRNSTPNGRDFFFSSEFPMVRFLERNGYDVSYLSGIDTARNGSLLLNHRVFMSNGHDEYWSGEQRANVEAARDAGVNLAFFSGNEVYWKTRWEKSVDGSNTDYRTLVCYKETQKNAKVDPSSQWTGTWRDPRFSPPSDGGRPENALTGTAYMSNTGGFALQVPAAIGKMRLWRNTSVANQANGGVATLAPNTLGYEFDADLDNGFRPAGLFHLSEQTEDVDELLQDYGSTVAPGTLTHNMTMYRAASGALVFGAGTIQWSWGLDSDHDGQSSPPDSRMQQATVNLLADMSVQPATLMSGLSAASASTDRSAPVSTITSPSGGATLASGSEVTVTGTATDSGGGVVAGVEVTTDGGATWHPAKGRGSWTYTFTVTGSGDREIRSRATDDSGNIEAPSAGVVTTAKCPCSIFADLVPKVPSDPDPAPLEVGVKFQADTSGYVEGVRFYKGAGNNGTHTGTLWSANGAQLAKVTFTNESASGWQEALFANPVEINEGQVYVVSYFAPNGRVAGDSNFFSESAYDAAPLHALKDGAFGANGVYRAGSSGFPTSTFKAANYYVDLIFDDTPPPDNTPPKVDAVSPVDGQTVVDPSTAIRAQLSERVQPGTANWTVTGPGGAVVTGASDLDSTRRIATFTPSAPLSPSTVYDVRLAAVTDNAGNVQATPKSWSFTTWASTPAAGDCPCSIWSPSDVPAAESVNDPGDIEVGVKFRSSQDGFITGLKFYKGAQNTGPHVATLWSSSGQELATTTFSFESGSGWQQVMLSPAIPVTAGQTYVASYHTTTGFYSATSNGLGSSVVRGPLTALGNGVDGGNGVYSYGERAFPTNSYANSNYWVDVVFNTPPDTTPPTVTSTSPSSGGVRVPTGTQISAVLSEAIQPNTAQLSVKDSNGAVISGTTAYDSASRTVTFTPNSLLSSDTQYTVTLAGAVDPAGNEMSPKSWKFTTSGSCPCTLFESGAEPANASTSDASATEVGVRFTPSTDGWISGARFYKGAANTGTHVASLWQSSDRALLARATFTSESSSGWQEVDFGETVRVTAGTEYVVSYHAPNGGYAASPTFFASPWSNGVLSAPASAGVYAYGSSTFPANSYNATNYWVDPVFVTADPADSSPPRVTSTSPVDFATTVTPGTTVSATFSEPLAAGPDPTLTLTSAAGSVVGITTYNSLSRTLTFTPGSNLQNSTTYTASITGVVDRSGNAMEPYSWTFTTAAAPSASCPCSIWPDTAAPAIETVSDSSPVELGVKFRSDSDGLITGIRFYKGPQNTGTHTGSLWTSNGTQLANATFSGESPAGWQTVSFSQPVTVSAGTTYVASYHTTAGMYSADVNGFSNTGVDRGPLHALQAGVEGANGVYSYGPSSFPTSGSTTNYWVDVVYAESVPDTSGPVISSVEASGSGTTSTVTWQTDEPSTSRVAYGTSSTTLNLNATSPGTSKSHSVTLNGLTANTRYWFRVTSVDDAGNSATAPDPPASPAQYAPSVTPLVQTSVADFAAGTTSSTYRSDMSGGEVVLAPVLGAEFAGTALPSGWTSTVLATGGTSTVSGNQLSVNGTAVTSTTTLSRPTSMEFAATFSGAEGQTVGYGTTATAYPWAVFRTRNGNELVASSRVGNTPVETVLPSSLLGSKHTYRIDSVGGTITYRVDGAVVASHNMRIRSSMRAVIAKSTTGGTALSVDWVRLSRYPTSGTFTTSVLDAGAGVSWDTASWSADLPAAGGQVTVAVRTGNVASPNATWSAWTTVTSNGGSIGRLARYAQVQLNLTSSSDRLWTPVVSDVALAYSVP